MAQMLAMLLNELQNNWDEQLPQVELEYNNSVSVATGLTPNEVHMGRLPRLPLTILNAPRSLATRAWPATTSHTATWRPTASSARTISSMNTMPSQFIAWNAATQLLPTHCARFPNSPLAAGCRCTIRLPPSAKARIRTRPPRSPRPSSRLTGRPPTKSSQLALVPPLKPRMALPWALSSCVWLARRRVWVQRCKPCANPPDRGDMSKYLPAELTQYVLNNFSKKSPPYHVT